MTSTRTMRMIEYGLMFGLLLLAGLWILQCSAGENGSCTTDNDCPYPQACINAQCVGGTDGGDGGPTNCPMSCPSGTHCVVGTGDWDGTYWCQDSSGKKQGIQVEYDSDGNKIGEITFQNGQANGDAKLYYPDGKLQEEGNYKDGLKDGTFTSYYDNGNKERECSYTADVPNGPCTSWYEDGNLASQGQYKDGNPDGKWTTYYDSPGAKETEGYYNNGIRCGDWTYYNQDGSVDHVEQNDPCPP